MNGETWMFRERKDPIISDDLKQIREAFNFLAKKHAPNIEALQEVEFSNGSILLNHFHENKTNQESIIPVINGKMEMLFTPWPDYDEEDKHPLTQAAIQYQAKRLNELIKDENEAIKSISAFITMFINENDLLTSFGKDLRKQFQEILFVQNIFNLTKEDLSDKNIKDFLIKTSAYQQKLESELDTDPWYHAFFR